MAVFYDLVFLFAAFIYLPILLIRGKWHKAFLSRFGLPDKFLGNLPSGSRNIWIHAVSVGEVMAVKNLVKRIKEQYPDYALVFSTVTETGNNLAKQQFPDDCIIYAPLDFSWIVKSFIKKIHPSIYIAAETEIWPNLYIHLKKNNIPILQVNGRISEKGFVGYQRLRFFMQRPLKAVSIFCMQSQIDADRIMSLGAPIQNVKVVGNLKFDEPKDIGIKTKEELFFSTEDLVFMAGSTHPGEEQIIVDAYKKLLPDFPHMKLIIAPRHIERVSDVQNVLKNNRIPFINFSANLADKKKITTALIIDKIGYLRSFYAIADVVFVGKSFKVGGGQNMIEPLSYGKPTFVGPLVQNFKNVVEVFKKEKAIFIVDNPQNLAYQIKEVLRDPLLIKEISVKTSTVISRQQGSIEKTLQAIQTLIRK